MTIRVTARTLDDSGASDRPPASGNDWIGFVLRAPHQRRVRPGTRPKKVQPPLLPGERSHQSMTRCSLHLGTFKPFGACARRAPDDG